MSEGGNFSISRVIWLRKKKLTSVILCIQMLKSSLTPVLRRRWKDKDTQRKAFDNIATQLGITTQEEWYSVTTEQVQKHGAMSILSNYYKNCLMSALRSIYPEYTWNPHLKVGSSPNYHWRSEKNQRIQMDEMAEQLGIETQHDWYKVTTRQLQRIRGRSIIQDYYNGSLLNALKSIYPEFEWNKDEFHLAQRQSLEKKMIAYHRKQLDHYGALLNLNTQQDWYKVTGVAVKKIGASKMINSNYNGSLFRALQTVYPEFDWDPLRCYSLPSARVDRALESLSEVVKKFPPTQSHDFPLVQILNRVSRKFGRLKTLTAFYPKAAWTLLQGGRGESLLENALSNLSDVRRNLSIAGHSIDLFLPEYGLAFEFQGKQHYKQTYRGSFSNQHSRDRRKKQELKEVGVSLIEVPYWWNGNFETLLATIQRQL